MWFCSSVGGVVSFKETGKVGRKKKKKKSYSELVTPSDEAFALMALKYHHEKWKAQPEEEAEPPKKKKRVSGAGNSESRKYYTEMWKVLNEFRERNKDKYLVAESWMEKKIEEAAGTAEVSGSPGAGGPGGTAAAAEEDAEVVCADVNGEINFNPNITSV